MSDPFADALGVIYNAAGSLGATYRPKAAGDPLSVRLIREQADEDGSLRSTLQHSNTFSVRKSDVAKPIKGDRFTIDGQDFEVLGEPRTDAEGLTWYLGASPV